MRRLLLVTSALVAVCGSARADGVNNPGVLPTSALTPGMCVQATGPNTVATVNGSCGTTSGAGNVDGPTSSTIGDVATWANGTGTAIADGGVALSALMTSASARATFLPFTAGELTGTLAVPELDVNGGAGEFKLVRYLTAGAFNFSIGLDQVGNYTLFRHNPSTNAVIDTPFVVQLSSGLFNFSQRPVWSANSTQATPWDNINLPSPFTTAGGTVTGPITAQQININGAAGVSRPLQFNTDGAQRWQISADSNDNLALFAFPDTGSPILVMAGSRATGDISFGANVSGVTPAAGDNSARFATTAFVQGIASNLVPQSNGNISITGTLTANFGITTPSVVTGGTLDAGSGGINSSGPISGNTANLGAVTTTSLAIQSSAVGALCNQGGANGFTTSSASACPGTTSPYRIHVPLQSGPIGGALGANVTLFAVVFDRTVTFQAGLAGSICHVGSPPAGAQDVELEKNGTSFSSVTIFDNSTTVNFNTGTGGAQTFGVGDVLSGVLLGTQDTFTGLSCTLVGSVAN
jgi:hypothetical protein